LGASPHRMSCRRRIILASGGLLGWWPTAEEDRLNIQLIRCDDVCRLVKGPALAVFTMLRLTEFWVQQQICCGADNDESDDKHQHPIGHFPLPSGNPGA
jgi:hypothetical protein